MIGAFVWRRDNTRHTAVAGIVFICRHRHQPALRMMFFFCHELERQTFRRCHARFAACPDRLRLWIGRLVAMKGIAPMRPNTLCRGFAAGTLCQSFVQSEHQKEKGSHYNSHLFCHAQSKNGSYRFWHDRENAKNTFIKYIKKKTVSRRSFFTGR